VAGFRLGLVVASPRGRAPTPIGVTGHRGRSSVRRSRSAGCTTSSRWWNASASD